MEWINQTNNDGLTALQIANNCGNYPFYEHLVQKGARKNMMSPH